MDDYYSILEVSSSASSQEIKESYRFLAQANHPDKFGSIKHKKRAEERIKRINEAYEILSDSEQRARYDRNRSSQSSWAEEEKHQRDKTEAEQRRRQEQQQREQAEKAQAEQKLREEEEQRKSEEDTINRRAEEEQQLREQATKAQVDFGKRCRGAILGGVALCFLVIFTISHQYQLLEEKKMATTQAEARAMAEMRALEEASANLKLANEAEYMAKQQAAEAERQLKLKPQLSEEQSLTSQDVSSSIGQSEYVDGFKLIHLTDLDSKDYLNYIDQESIEKNDSKVRWVAIALPRDESKPRYRSIREGDCEGDWNQITESAKKQPEESEYSHIGGIQPVSNRIAEEEKIRVCQIFGMNLSTPIGGM